MITPRGTVLLTGATGFVGSHLDLPLRQAGWTVVCGTREPDRARQQAPDRRWIACDLAQVDTLEAALTGCDAALYLVHGVGLPGFEHEDPQLARRFGQVCARAGVRRIAYLGGMSAQGPQSPHLQSRHDTGVALAEAGVEVVELRACMVIGAGSASWQLVRDLAVRAPLLTVPPWLEHRSQPIGIADVAQALVAALSVPQPGCFDLPGPEVLTGREILSQTAHLAGTRPLLTPTRGLDLRLAAWATGLLTRTDRHVAHALFQSLTADILQTRADFWPQVSDRPKQSFLEATTQALVEDRLRMPLATLALETALQLARPWPWRQP
jgi:uncharacterized protein YbjT (DUF2867 family)